VFPNVSWLLVGVLLDPLIVFLSISLVIAVSQHVKTSKSAQSVAMILILPIIGSLISQASGVLLFGIQFAVLLATVLAVIDVVLFLFIAKRFNREEYILNI